MPSGWYPSQIYASVCSTCWLTLCGASRSHGGPAMWHVNASNSCRDVLCTHPRTCWSRWASIATMRSRIRWTSRAHGVERDAWWRPLGRWALASRYRCWFCTRSERYRVRRGDLLHYKIQWLWSFKNIIIIVHLDVCVSSSPSSEIKTDQTQCWIELGEPWRWQLYMSLIAGALFVLPAIIITACYAIIIRTIWAKGAMLVTTGMDLHKDPSQKQSKKRDNWDRVLRDVFRSALHRHSGIKFQCYILFRPH